MLIWNNGVGKIKNDKYYIEITRVHYKTFRELVDNYEVVYDIILNPTNFDPVLYYPDVLSIAINYEKNTQKKVQNIYRLQKNIAIIGNLVSHADNDDGYFDVEVILEDDILIVMMNDVLIVFECSTLSMVKHTELPGVVHYSIEQFDNGYIVHGECSIIKLTSDFDIEWTFDDADIFVTINGECPFEIRGDTIHLCDFTGYKCVLDKFGKVIR